jgi:hypothetical protein
MCLDGPTRRDLPAPFSREPCDHVYRQADLSISLNICLESECDANLWLLLFHLSNIDNSCSASVPRAVAASTSTIVQLPQAALATALGADKKKPIANGVGYDY